MGISPVRRVDCCCLYNEIPGRNHVEGMGFYTNAETGERGGTNVHFNKPYLIRKWLPHYDWVLWLDMDTLVVDLAKPVEKFIEEVGGQVRRRYRCVTVAFRLHCLFALPFRRRYLFVLYLCYRCVTCPLPLLPLSLRYLCTSVALPLCHRCDVVIALPFCYRVVTAVLPLRYRCVTVLLPLCYLCVTFALPLPYPYFFVFFSEAPRVISSYPKTFFERGRVRNPFSTALPTWAQHTWI